MISFTIWVFTYLRMYNTYIHTYVYLGTYTSMSMYTIHVIAFKSSSRLCFHMSYAAFFGHTSDVKITRSEMTYDFNVCRMMCVIVSLGNWSRIFSRLSILSLLKCVYAQYGVKVHFNLRFIHIQVCFSMCAATFMKVIRKLNWSRVEL